MSDRKDRIKAYHDHGLSYQEARRKVAREDIREAIDKMFDANTQVVLGMMFDYICDGED